MGAVQTWLPGAAGTAPRQRPECLLVRPALRLHSLFILSKCPTCPPVTPCPRAFSRAIPRSPLSPAEPPPLTQAQAWAWRGSCPRPSRAGRPPAGALQQGALQREPSSRELLTFHSRAFSAAVSPGTAAASVSVEMVSFLSWAALNFNFWPVFIDCPCHCPLGALSSSFSGGSQRWALRLIFPSVFHCGWFPLVKSCTVAAGGERVVV